MMTYYAIFAIMPLVLFALTVALLVVPQSAIDEGIDMLAAVAPPRIVPMLRTEAHRLTEAAGGHVAAFGALLALWAGSRQLNRVRVALHRGGSDRRPWWRQQLTVLAVTLGAVLLTCAALALLVAGPWLLERLGIQRGWGALRWILAGLLVLVVWAGVYHFLRDQHGAFRLFTPGTVTGVALWIVASRLFALYLASFARIEATYGALGAVIIFLYWLWLSNFALLVGAEIDDLLRETTPAKETHVKREDRIARSARDRTALTQADGGGLGKLTRRLGDDVGLLVRDHVELARLELAHEARKAMTDIAVAALGTLVTVVGFALLCSTAVVALAPLIPPLWLRMLIMSGVYLIVGGLVVGAFVKKLRRDATLPRTATDEARTTARFLREQVHHGVQHG